MVHQDRENPIRTADQDFSFFFTENGGLVCRASKPTTQNMLQDRRIYGENFIFYYFLYFKLSLTYN